MRAKAAPLQALDIHTFICCNAFEDENDSCSDGHLVLPDKHTCILMLRHTLRDLDLAKKRRRLVRPTNS
jgi:hypothetical protein